MTVRRPPVWVWIVAPIVLAGIIVAVVLLTRPSVNPGDAEACHDYATAYDTLHADTAAHGTTTAQAITLATHDLYNATRTAQTPAVLHQVKQAGALFAQAVNGDRASGTAFASQSPDVVAACAAAGVTITVR